jgi:lysophospholipase L1-like esterase
LEELKLVLDHYSFAVIQFNNGMHGWQHSEAEYAAAFPKLVETVRERAKGAKLVWADTTPLKDSMPPATGAAASPDKAVERGKLMLKADLAKASDERIAQRNRIAREAVARWNIPCVDLNTPMLGHPEYHTDNVHFNSQGIAIQADLVAAEITTLLRAN